MTLVSIIVVGIYLHSLYSVQCRINEILQIKILPSYTRSRAKPIIELICFSIKLGYLLLVLILYMLAKFLLPSKFCPVCFIGGILSLIFVYQFVFFPISGCIFAYTSAKNVRQYYDFTYPIQISLEIITQVASISVILYYLLYKKLMMMRTQLPFYY